MKKIKEFFKKNFENNNEIYASPLKRLGSFFVDMIIIMVIFNAVVNIASHYGYDGKMYKEEVVVENKGTDNEIVSFKEILDLKVFRQTYFILFAISSLYFVLFLSSKKQATLGNQMFKIMVVHTKKAKINPLIAFIRHIALLLNNYLYGVGYLLYFFRADHAFLQDVLSDTRVINIKK